MHLSLELRKENSVRVTYTLKEVEIKIINHYSELYNLSKSKFVSNSIEHGFKFMEEELEDFRKKMMKIYMRMGKNIQVLYT